MLALMRCMVRSAMKDCFEKILLMILNHRILHLRQVAIIS
ncbi:UNVERIFIED_CONTAM: hypothetical protein GTU68_059205 [Idotea baltica]|nr:hypothetical protein [Idotea baltica]